MQRQVILRFRILSGDKDTRQIARKLVSAAKYGLAFLGRSLRGFGWEIEIHNTEGEYERFKFTTRQK